MAQNSIQDGDILTYTVPSATTIASGAGVLIGGLFGVCLNGGTTGEKVDICLTGVFELPKNTGASPSTAITLGGPVYWDNTAKKVTGVATDNTLIGRGWAAAANGDTTALVRLSN